MFEQEIFVNLGSRLADRLVPCTLPKRAYPLGFVSYAINTLNDVRNVMEHVDSPEIYKSSGQR